MKAIKLYLRFSTSRNHHLRLHQHQHYLHHHQHHHLRSLYSLSSTLHAPHSQFSYASALSPHHLAPPHFPRVFPNHLLKQLFSETPDTTKCWNCGSGRTSELFLICDSCRCIQPLDHSVDYFQLFGLERKYNMEEVNLDTKYKDWQKKLHPDLVHSKSETEREYAAEQSSRVIDAYRTLTNSLSRAIYLMKLQGVHVDEEQTVSDPDLLAEIMELRESVEDAADAQALKQIQAQVLEKLEWWTESFARAFNSQDTEDALSSIRRMTYYKRANEEIVKRL